MSALATSETAMVHAATFRLGSEWFGIDVLKIQEIMNPLPRTSVPLAPDYVIGLINVRGLIVSCISMKRRLGFPDDSYNDDHHNIIVNAQTGTVRMVVDEIGDVIMADSIDVEEKPSTVATSAHDYIEGVIKMDSRLITFLNADLLAGV